MNVSPANPGGLLNQSANRRPLFELFRLILSVYQKVDISYLLADEPLDALKDAARRFVMEGANPSTTHRGQ